MSGNKLRERVSKALGLETKLACKGNTGNNFQEKAWFIG